MKQPSRRTNRIKRCAPPLGPRAFLGLGVVVVALCMLLAFFGAPAAPIAHAQNPTLDAARNALAQATVEAQQAKDAAAATLASQQMTASALDNQRRVAALTQQAADFQATRSAANTQATQTAAANATAQSVRATATAVAMATSAEQTRVADQQRRDEATRTFERTRTFEQAQSDNATRTTQQIQAIQTADAQATRAAQDRQAAAEERDAVMQTLGTLAIIGALVFALVAVGRYAWQRAKPRPVVEIVEDAQRQTRAAPSPEPTTTQPPTIEYIPQTDATAWDDPNQGPTIIVGNTAPASGPEPFTTVSPPSDAVTQLVIDMILKQEHANRGSDDSAPSETIPPGGPTAGATRSA